ncbi:MAG: YrdC/Sua5 family protein, required for threonylcarbamoyladenosine (T(6)A) formation in tRNA [Clostridiales bacterium 38_11]|nr:MAG: YrdC/Sua5 family protein, required for threonylcarbamoyladenosine (T(6)A) formation in tRNA [Clostridiales bacterium 38_11]HBH13327.1 threonylcarbamoyl-AMP synthase [Clostridiales bacterium]
MTKIIKIDKENIDEALIIEMSHIIKNNGTVVFPTETVYGLGANALSDVAVAKIFAAKGRPSDNPLIVHVSNIEQLDKIVEIIPVKAKILMDKFWPGPLTLLFKKKAIISDLITGGLDTVAVRMPSSRIALKLIEACDLPLAGPSANISGKPSPTTAEHVIKDLDGRVDAIIDGGDCEFGMESTVIDVLNETPMILRPGSITLEAIAQTINTVIYDPAMIHDTLIAKSPGQKYIHYAPKGEVYLYIGVPSDIIDAINQATARFINESKKVMILGTEENIMAYKEGIIFNLGSRTNPMEISSNLFSMLRKADELKADIILAEGIDEEGLGVAIMNRLRKASGGRIINCGELI